MSPQRILVVDDEADIRGLLSEILAEEGYEIEVAADAASARRAAARQEPDLVPVSYTHLTLPTILRV